MTKKILVTGAAGFIGSHISQKLLENGYSVVGVDILEKNPRHKNFPFHHINILDRKKLDAAIKEKQCSHIIHCAGKTGVRESMRNPLEYYETNAVGTLNLLESVRMHNPDTKLIIFSSSSVYGLQKTVPFSEDMLPNPQSPYGYSKHIMELCAKQYAHIYNLPIIVVRPFSVYGAWGRANMAPHRMIRAAEKGIPFVRYGNNKNNRRDWTYIDDCVGAILQIVKRHDFSRFEIVNIGNGNPVGIEDWIRIMQNYIQQYFKKKILIIKKPANREEMPITHADTKKAKKLIEYNPTTNIEKGLEKVFQHYFQQRDTYKKIWENR